MSTSKNALTCNNPVYNYIWYTLRRLCYNAEERVPVIDQPYIWLFVSNHLYQSKLMGLLEQINLGTIKIKGESLLLNAELSKLTVALQERQRDVVEEAKALPLCGLHYSALIECVWTAASDRISDHELIHGANASVNLKRYYCEAWLQKQMGKELYDDLLYCKINGYEGEKLLEPLSGKEYQLIKSSIPLTLKLTAELKKIEPIHLMFEGKRVCF